MTVTTGPTPEHVDAELNSGDRMTRAEFHRVYSQMPSGFRAELVEGVVYVASPLKIRHGHPHMALASVFFAYESGTPGVESGDNTTVLLGDQSELQPDLYLRILPEFGGQSRTSPDDYVEGPPELIAEVANSTHSLDLHGKRHEYRRHGVLEYLVLSVKEQKLFWIDLATDQELPVGHDGIVRARTFPGLWIDAGAVFRKDANSLMSVVQQGLASPEHVALVQKLAAAGAGRAGS